MFWPKLTLDQINQRVSAALRTNVNFRKTPVLGIPGSYLDPEIFYDDAPFLKDAPFLSTMIANPNHIGCHTLNEAEKLFSGTQQLEKEVIKICSEEIFCGSPDQQDGYVSSGGTEANIEAVWIYRNYFKNEFKAKPEEIAVMCSDDSHYSIYKAANLLGLENVIVLRVDHDTRMIDPIAMETSIQQAHDRGIKYIIGIVNLSTTMFGSVDDIEALTRTFTKHNFVFRFHIDAAFGGFIYPFTHPNTIYSFKNPHVTSITIDAHKMLQTPYGTGIFLVRKGYLSHVHTAKASYVNGYDHTLCGSRSGANAIAVWITLHFHGAEQWKVKMRALADRTTEVCRRLEDMGIAFYRNPYVNIIAIKSQCIPKALAEKYYLVPNNYETPDWWKIVIMPHITRGSIDLLMTELKMVTTAKA